MDKIKHVKEPEGNSTLYRITYINNVTDEEYVSCVTKNGLKKAKIEDKMRELGYDMELIDDYEHSVIECHNEY